MKSPVSIQIDPYLNITDVYIDVIMTHNGAGHQVARRVRGQRGGVLLAIIPGTARSVVSDPLTHKRCVETVEVIRLVYGCIGQSYDRDKHENLAREAAKLAEERRLEVVELTDKVARLQDENKRMREQIDLNRSRASYRRCFGEFDDDNADGSVTHCTSTRGCGLNGCPARR